MSRDLKNLSPVVIAADQGEAPRGTKFRQSSAGGRMPGPISGGLGAVAFAEPWLRLSVTGCLCLPEQKQHLLGGVRHSQAEKKVNCFPPCYPPGWKRGEVSVALHSTSDLP